MADDTDCKALRAQRAELQKQLAAVPELAVEKLAALNVVLGEISEVLGGSLDDLDAWQKKIEGYLKKLEKKAPELHKRISELLKKLKKTDTAEVADAVREWAGELRKTLDWYRDILTKAEEHYRNMEGDVPTRLDTFATFLEQMAGALPEPPNLKDIDPKLPDVKIPDAAKVMRDLMLEYAKSVRLAGEAAKKMKEAQDQLNAVSKELDDLGREVVGRVKSLREQLADRRRELEERIAALDAQLATVCPEPGPYDVCRDPNHRVNAAFDKADLDPTVAAAKKKRSEAVLAWRKAAEIASEDLGRYQTECAYLTGALDLFTVPGPDGKEQLPVSVQTLSQYLKTKANPGLVERIKRELRRHADAATRANEEYGLHLAAEHQRFRELEAAAAEWKAARDAAIDKIAKEEKWTSDDEAVLEQCHPDVKITPRPAAPKPERPKKLAMLVGAGATLAVLLAVTVALRDDGSDPVASTSTSGTTTSLGAADGKPNCDCPNVSAGLLTASYQRDCQEREDEIAALADLELVVEDDKLVSGQFCDSISSGPAAWPVLDGPVEPPPGASTGTICDDPQGLIQSCGDP